MSTIDKKREGAASIATRLLRWYRANARDLPWRRTGDPYAVWLSEVMLQQTQVVTVVAYYERFLEKFPTVGSLAAAPTEQVLALWAGLGYYSRARHLHASAKQVVTQHGGRFPATVDGLLQLPGVGRYTAGAIASIAFDQKAAVLDGNVARVLARLFVVRAPIKLPATQKKLWALAESILPDKHCGDFNQALMELGATICTPTGPRCEACPLRSHCGAFKADLVNNIPTRTSKPAPREMNILVAAIRAGDRYLFERRPDKGLWAGLWQMPAAECTDDKLAADVIKTLARRHDLRGLRIQSKPPAIVDRTLTHRQVRFTIHRCTARPSLNSDANDAARWIAAAEATTLPMSAAMGAVLAAVL